MNISDAATQAVHLIRELPELEVHLVNNYDGTYSIHALCTWSKDRFTFDTKEQIDATIADMAGEVKGVRR